MVNQSQRFLTLPFLCAHCVLGGEWFWDKPSELLLVASNRLYGSFPISYRAGNDVVDGGCLCPIQPSLFPAVLCPTNSQPFQTRRHCSAWRSLADRRSRREQGI